MYMKKWNWLCPVLMILCLAVFFGYRMLDQIRTDTTPPAISISQEALEASVYDDKSALLAGVTAQDDRDGDVTDSLVVESIRLVGEDGLVSVGYAAFDAAGNVAKATRQVRYTDYQGPVFSLSAPLVFIHNSGFDVLDVISASDALDGDITHRIRAASVDDTTISTLGSHEVKFRVSNSLSDTASLVLPVEVHASDVYNASLTLTSYLDYVQVGADFNARRYLDKLTLGAEVISLTNGIPANITVKTTGDADTQTPGVYCIDYTVTYSAGNPGSTRTYTGFSRLIVIVEG